MKRLVKNILVILTLSLLINACAPCPEPTIVINKVNKYVECPAPLEPSYGLFNEDLHIGHLGNLEMLRTNLESVLRYNDSLENTLDCYKTQAEKPNE